MGMVAAICTQCGAAIEVDESKEAGICSHCGTAFITEKVINNYHIHNTTNVTNNIANATINVKNGDDEYDYCRRVAAHALTGSKHLIEKTAAEMQEKFPHKGVTYLCKADSLLSYDYWTNNRIDIPILKSDIEKFEQSGRKSTRFGNEKTVVKDYELSKAKEALDRADQMMTPDEKEKYADYERSVREKFELRDKYNKYLEEAARNSTMQYENERRKKRKILTGAIAAIAIVVAVVVVVLILK